MSLQLVRYGASNLYVQSLKLLGKGSFGGRGRRVFADFKRQNTLVDVIRVPKVRISGEYLPIDTNFVSILLLVSVLFLRTSKAKANYKGSNLRKIGN